MQLEAILWLVLPLFVAGGSALVAYYIMQGRMEVALAKERESLAEAKAIIQSHKVTMEERIKAVEESTRRAALDEMMQEIRIEERSYVRDANTPEGAKRTLVLQERVFFRNIPMSGWTEREMLIEHAPVNGLSPRPENLEPALVTAGTSRHLTQATEVTAAPAAKAAAAGPMKVVTSPTPQAPKTPVVMDPPATPRRLVVVPAFGAQ